MPNPSVEQLIQTIIKHTTSAVDSEEAYIQLLESGEVAIQALLDTINDETHNQHHMIASILCDILVDIENETALSTLRSLVNHPNQAVYTPSARAIARFRTPNIDAVLCQLLEHHAPQVRRIVAWQIGRNRAGGAMACLIRHLDEKDTETLRGIIWSLGHIGDHRTRQYIETFMHHISSDIAFIAREAIQRIEDKSFDLPFK